MKQQGFSLIELMIAGLIGTFLLISLMNLFITTNRSVSLSDALSQNQETGRFALDYMTRFIRIAGYAETFDSQTFPELYTLSAGANINCNGAQAEACAGNDLPGIKGDRIAITFSSRANVQTRTCSGQLVGGDGVGGQIYVNVFWVSEDQGSEGDLVCRTFLHNTGWLDNAPVSIVSNVESLQFQVGLGDQKGASSYEPIDVVLNNPSLTENIRSIKIAILTTSADSNDVEAVQTNKDLRQYAILDGPLMEFDDGQLRSVFTSTIELPNAITKAAMSN